MRLVPVGKLTFPDQQQDLQNAANLSLTYECDGGVKVFGGFGVNADSGAFRLPDGVRGRIGRSTGVCSLLYQPSGLF